MTADCHELLRDHVAGRGMNDLVYMYNFLRCYRQQTARRWEVSVSLLKAPMQLPK